MTISEAISIAGTRRGGIRIRLTEELRSYGKAKRIYPPYVTH